MLAETLFSGIRVLGFREIEFELTPQGAALGLAEALPSGRLELRVSGDGWGERVRADTTSPLLLIAVTNVPSREYRSSEIA
jgi:hypothetical protein